MLEQLLLGQSSSLLRVWSFRSQLPEDWAFWHLQVRVSFLYLLMCWSSWEHCDESVTGALWAQWPQSQYRGSVVCLGAAAAQGLTWILLEASPLPTKGTGQNLLGPWLTELSHTRPGLEPASCGVRCFTQLLCCSYSISYWNDLGFLQSVIAGSMLSSS